MENAMPTPKRARLISFLIAGLAFIIGAGFTFVAILEAYQH